MKQPENAIEIFAHPDSAHGVYITVLEGWWDEVPIGEGKTKKLALSAAIRRLNRLASDCQKKLDKL